MRKTILFVLALPAFSHRLGHSRPRRPATLAAHFRIAREPDVIWTGAKPPIRSRVMSGDRQHDLSEVSVGAHHGERIGHVFERKRLVDRQGELAGFDRRPQIGAHRSVDLAHLLGRARAERDADIIDALERVQVEIELALLAAEPADIDDAAEQCGRRQILVGDAGRNLVDDKVDALAGGGFLHLLRPIRIA